MGQQCVDILEVFPLLPQRLFGEDLPLQQNGFVSATEMLSALNDTFHLKPVSDESGQQWKVVDILHSDVTQSGALLQTGPHTCHYTSVYCVIWKISNNSELFMCKIIELGFLLELLKIV